MYYKNEREWVEHDLLSFEEKGLSHFYKNPFDLNGEKVDIVSSSKPDQLVGSIIFGTREDAERAVNTSSQFYNEGQWSKTQWQERSSILLKWRIF